MPSKAIEATRPVLEYDAWSAPAKELEDYHQRYARWKEALADPRGYGWGKPWLRKFGSLDPIDQQVEAEKLGFESVEEMALDMGLSVAEVQGLGWGKAVEPHVLDAFEAKLDKLQAQGKEVRVESPPHYAWHTDQYSKTWVWATYNAAGQIVTPEHWKKSQPNPRFGGRVRATVEVNGKKRFFWYDDRTLQISQSRLRVKGGGRITFAKFHELEEAGEAPEVEEYTYSWTQKPGWRISTPH